MNINFYSQLADSLMLTFSIHCLFICQESWTASPPAIISPCWLKMPRIARFHQKLQTWAQTGSGMDIPVISSSSGLRLNFRATVISLLVL